MALARIAFHTLGCKLNQYETDAIASQFLRAGYQAVPFGEAADVCVVNTCTVTNKADRKSRNVINRALKTIGGSNRRLVVVTGCYAESNRSALNDEELIYVVGNDNKSSIFQIVDAHMRGEIYTPPKADRFAFDPAAPIFHTRSMIKIQDGCDNFCSFCIIPYVRGRAESRAVSDVLEDVFANLDLGYREVVLTGVNMSRYRYQDGEETIGFIGLLARVLAVEGDFRVRISSLEPDSLDDRFFELMNHPRMCPHLHLCLQSGSERILLAMRRQYTLQQYLNIIERIRSTNANFNVTTDIVVGFPGETEAEFQQSCDVAQQVNFSHIHTFKYSKRSGTRAERMPGQVDEAVKNERSAVMRAISDDNKRRHRRSMVGMVQRLIVERVEADGVGGQIGRGYGQHYAPIAMRAPHVESNRFYMVRIADVDESSAADPCLIGAPICDPLLGS